MKTKKQILISNIQEGKREKTKRGYLLQIGEGKILWQKYNDVYEVIEVEKGKVIKLKDFEAKGWDYVEEKEDDATEKAMKLLKDKGYKIVKEETKGGNKMTNKEKVEDTIRELDMLPVYLRSKYSQDCSRDETEEEKNTEMWEKSQVLAAVKSLIQECEREAVEGFVEYMKDHYYDSLESLEKDRELIIKHLEGGLEAYLKQKEETK